MGSNKSKKAKLAARREKRKSRSPVLDGGPKRKEVAGNTAPCNPRLLAPHNSWSPPDFATRGYYCDLLFRCATCGTEEVWSATQQKWWYEVAKGYLHSTAKLCRACRAIERHRKTEARRVHLEGLARKKRGGAP